MQSFDYKSDGGEPRRLAYICDHFESLVRIRSTNVIDYVTEFSIDCKTDILLELCALQIEYDLLQCSMEFAKPRTMIFNYVDAFEQLQSPRAITELAYLEYKAMHRTGIMASPCQYASVGTDVFSSIEARLLMADHELTLEAPIAEARIFFQKTLLAKYPVRFPSEFGRRMTGDPSKSYRCNSIRPNRFIIAPSDEKGVSRRQFQARWFDWPPKIEIVNTSRSIPIVVENRGMIHPYEQMTFDIPIVLSLSSSAIRFLPQRNPPFNNSFAR